MVASLRMVIDDIEYTIPMPEMVPAESPRPHRKSGKTGILGNRCGDTRTHPQNELRESGLLMRECCVSGGGFGNSHLMLTLALGGGIFHQYSSPFFDVRSHSIYGG